MCSVAFLSPSSTRPNRFARSAFLDLSSCERREVMILLLIIMKIYNNKLIIVVMMIMIIIMIITINPGPETERPPHP